MNDLVTWLRAQLDEDERAARAVEDLRKPYYFDFIDDAARPFVERELDPERVLRQVKRDQHIIDEHTCGCPDPDCRDCGACSGPHHADPAPAPCTTLRLLAMPYADRPGYRDEWRPTAS